MSKIYVIVGSAGSYDSYRTWNVKAYTDEEAAKASAIEMKKIVKNERKAYEKWKKYPARGRTAEELVEYLNAAAERTGDPDWTEFDEDGEYEVQELELI